MPARKRSTAHPPNTELALRLEREKTSRLLLELESERAKSSRLQTESAEKDRIVAAICRRLDLEIVRPLDDQIVEVVGERAALRAMVDTVKETSIAGALNRVRFMVEDRERLVDAHARAKHATTEEFNAHAKTRRELEETRAKLEQLETLFERERAENSIRLESFARDLGEARRGLDGAARFIGAMGGRDSWR